MKMTELFPLEVNTSPFNPFAFRTAKTLWSFGRSEYNRVKYVTLLSDAVKVFSL